jgi:hypothetical protein
MIVIYYLRSAYTRGIIFVSVGMVLQLEKHNRLFLVSWAAFVEHTECPSGKHPLENALNDG